jgi:hypothetical protein
LVGFGCQSGADSIKNLASLFVNLDDFSFEFDCLDDGLFIPEVLEVEDKFVYHVFKGVLVEIDVV